MSFLFAILPQNRDISPVFHCLRGFDIDFQVKSTFEGLAPFAESYASGQDLNAEVTEEAGSSPFVATGHAVPSEGYQINGGDALVLRLSRLPEQPTVAKEEVEEVRSVDGNVDEEEDVLPVKMEVKEEEEQNRSRRRAAPFPAWTVPKVEEPWSPQENDDEATEALSVKSEVREEEEQNEVIGGDGNEENPPPLMTDFPGIADVGDDFAFHRNESPLPTRNPAKKRKIMETEEEEGTSEGEDDGRQRRERESANRKSNRVVGKEQANIDFDNNYEEKDDVLEDRGSPLGDMEPNDRLRSIRRRVLRDELGENDQEEEKKMKEKEDEEEQAQNDSMDDGNEERKCPVDGCSEKFTSFEGVMKHMKKHPAPWICGVCKRQWPRRTHLRQHYRIHCGEKPFKCATCQKTFSQSNNLKTHQRIHTGERSYECYVCDYKTSEPSNLKRHQRMHTGERPYPCTVCKKSFTQSFDLTRHMRIHTGERPYECDKCDYRATRLRNLQSHKRTHSH